MIMVECSCKVFSIIHSSFLIFGLSFLALRVCNGPAALCLSINNIFDQTRLDIFYENAFLRCAHVESHVA